MKKTTTATIAAMLMAAVMAVPGGASAQGWGGHGKGHGMSGMEGMGPMGPGGGFDFAAIDADGDGKITQEEFAAFRKARHEGLDADGDGLISAEEMTAHMMAEMGDRMAEMAKARVAALDSDGDGKLSAEELAAGPMPARIFDRLDSDGDGAVSQDEVAAARKAMAGRDGHRKGRGHGWFGWGQGGDDDNG